MVTLFVRYDIQVLGTWCYNISGIVTHSKFMNRKQRLYLIYLWSFPSVKRKPFRSIYFWRFFESKICLWTLYILYWIFLLFSIKVQFAQNFSYHSLVLSTHVFFRRAFSNVKWIPKLFYKNWSFCWLSSRPCNLLIHSSTVSNFIIPKCILGYSKFNALYETIRLSFLFYNF